MRSETEILALNAFDRSAVRTMDEDLRRAVERRLRSFGPASALFYEEPIRMARAKGVWMEAVDGRRYLDMYNNVPSVGHAHPRVVQAVQRQSALLSTHTRYLSDVVDTYAERLLETFPESLARLVLTCTGSEANDLALRIACAGTGATGFIVTRAAYHGGTAAVTDVSPASRPGRPMSDHVRVVAAPDAYRFPTDDLAGQFATDVKDAIDDLERIGIRVAGLLADTIFSSDGIFADPPGVLAGAVDMVRRRGGLFIADEVQPGFGRTGTAMWGFQRHGVVPDIVTMGKPMGNGFPMGGVATRPDLLDSFTAGIKYFNTFGGNPVAAAAGRAVLDVIRDEGLIENARVVGHYLMDRLREIADRHIHIGNIRGAGLFIGVELVRGRDTKEPAPEIATRVVNDLRYAGILIGVAGGYGNVLKIRPPLCFARSDADMFVTACDAALARQAGGCAIA